mgnify:CR=1 FL=1
MLSYFVEKKTFSLFESFDRIYHNIMTKRKKINFIHNLFKYSPSQNSIHLFKRYKNNLYLIFD